MQKNVNTTEMTKVLEELFSNLEKSGLQINNGLKENVINKITAAITEAYPGGVPESVMRSPEFTKKLTLAVTAAIDMALDPSYKLDLTLLFKAELAPIDLKECAKHLVTKMNELLPESLKLNEKQIDDVVKNILEKNDPTLLLGSLMEMKFLIDQRSFMEANLFGGIDSHGHFNPSAISTLFGNLQGLEMFALALSPTSTMADEVLERPNLENPNPLTKNFGLIDLIGEAASSIGTIMSRPRLSH